MASCDILPYPTGKACSGACMSPCSGGGRLWVVAASAGKMVRFAKTPEGAYSLILFAQDAIAPSTEYFTKSMLADHGAHAFDHVVLVGSEADIAWARAALPQELSACVLAEIEYPLLNKWFRNSGDMHELCGALGQVLAG